LAAGMRSTHTQLRKSSGTWRWRRRAGPRVSAALYLGAQGVNAVLTNGDITGELAGAALMEAVSLDALRAAREDSRAACGGRLRAAALEFGRWINGLALILNSEVHKTPLQLPEVFIGNGTVDLSDMRGNPYLFPLEVQGRLPMSGERMRILVERVFDHAGDSKDVTLGKGLGDGADAERAPGVVSGIVILFVFDGEILLHLLEDGTEERGFEFLGSGGWRAAIAGERQVAWVAQDIGGDGSDLRRAHRISSSACKAPAALSACRMETTSRALAPMAWRPLTNCSTVAPSLSSIRRVGASLALTAVCGTTRFRRFC